MTYKIVHKQYGGTGILTEDFNEAMQILQYFLKKEPGQYYMREI